MKKIINWFKSYGYYYKWHFIFGAFALVLVTVLVVQLFTKTNYSVYMTYMGAEALSVEKISDIKSSVNSVLRQELKNENYEISLRDIVYVNTELAKEYKKNDIYFSAQANSEAVTLLNQEVAVGDSYIYMIDKEQYEGLRDNNALTPLSDVFSQIPNGAVDDYGVCLKQTDFGKYFDCFKNFTDDVILCLRADTSSSALSFFKSKDKTHEQFELHKKIFYDIVTFELPDDSSGNGE